MGEGTEVPQVEPRLLSPTRWLKTPGQAAPPQGEPRPPEGMVMVPLLFRAQPKEGINYDVIFGAHCVGSLVCLGLWAAERIGMDFVRDSGAWIVPAPFLPCALYYSQVWRGGLGRRSATLPASGRGRRTTDWAGPRPAARTRTPEGLPPRCAGGRAAVGAAGPPRRRAARAPRGGGGAGLGPLLRAG
ncbi:unnamed protein product, partial [Prorocentrum cordatum]